MYLKQFYLGCLAHGSYLVGADGECAVIDPQRDVDQYIEEAMREGFLIKYIIETHLHADFVSGHKELSQRTGAQIVFGEKAGAAFPYLAVKNGDVLKIGTIRLSIIETPGHTPESICILAQDTESNEPAKLFSGDTLFIGDVGRPDLVGSKGFSAEYMAGLMYESLHEKLLKLPDEVEVLPAHGAGSLCGKHLSKERSSTIGLQKKFNSALQPMSKEAFVKMLIADQPEIPAYFVKDVELNRLGALPVKDLIRPLPMSAAEVLEKLQSGAVLLDVRNASDYARGHINGSLNIGLGGQFASWAGTFIRIGTPVILVTDDDKDPSAQVEEAVTRLARVGIESVIGYLQNGINNPDSSGLESAKSHVISVADLKQSLDEQDDLIVLDVRRSGEFEQGHAPGAINIPLAELEENFSSLPFNWPIAVICASGYRSTIACSILERSGIKFVMNVSGGTSAWIKNGYQTQTGTRPLSESFPQLMQTQSCGSKSCIETKDFKETDLCREQ